MMQVKHVTEEQVKELYKSLPEGLLSKVGQERKQTYLSNDAESDHKMFLRTKSLLSEYFSLKKQLDFIESELSELI